MDLSNKTKVNFFIKDLNKNLDLTVVYPDDETPDKVQLKLPYRDGLLVTKEDVLDMVKDISGGVGLVNEDDVSKVATQVFNKLYKPKTDEEIKNIAKEAIAETNPDNENNTFENLKVTEDATEDTDVVNLKQLKEIIAEAFTNEDIASKITAAKSEVEATIDGKIEASLGDIDTVVSNKVDTVVAAKIEEKLQDNIEDTVTAKVQDAIGDKVDEVVNSKVESAIQKKMETATEGLTEKTTQLETKAGELEEKSTQLETKATQLEEKANELETTTGELSTKTGQLETKTSNLEKKITTLESKDEALDSKIDGVADRTQALETSIETKATKDDLNTAKSDLNNKLDTKANKTDVYTKVETDNLINRAKEDINSNLSTNDTITGLDTKATQAKQSADANKAKLTELDQKIDQKVEELNNKIIAAGGDAEHATNEQIETILSKFDNYTLKSELQEVKTGLEDLATKDSLNEKADKTALESYVKADTLSSKIEELTDNIKSSLTSADDPVITSASLDSKLDTKLEDYLTEAKGDERYAKKTDVTALDSKFLTIEAYTTGNEELAGSIVEGIVNPTVIGPVIEAAFTETKTSLETSIGNNTRDILETKNEIKTLATKESLNDYLTKDDAESTYLKKTELPEQQDLSGYATTESVTSAVSEAVEGLADVYVKQDSLSTSLDGYETTTHAEETYLKKTDASNYLTSDSLENYALKSALETLEGKVTTLEESPVDLEPYLTKTEAEDTYAKKSEVSTETIESTVTEKIGEALAEYSTTAANDEKYATKTSLEGYTNTTDLTSLLENKADKTLYDTLEEQLTELSNSVQELKTTPREDVEVDTSSLETKEDATEKFNTNQSGISANTEEINKLKLSVTTINNILKAVDLTDEPETTKNVTLKGKIYKHPKAHALGISEIKLFNGLGHFFKLKSWKWNSITDVDVILTTDDSEATAAYGADIPVTPDEYELKLTEVKVKIVTGAANTGGEGSWDFRFPYVFHKLGYDVWEDKYYFKTDVNEMDLTITVYDHTWTFHKVGVRLAGYPWILTNKWEFDVFFDEVQGKHVVFEGDASNTDTTVAPRSQQVYSLNETVKTGTAYSKVITAVKKLEEKVNGLSSGSTSSSTGDNGNLQQVKEELEASIEAVRSALANKVNNGTLAKYTTTEDLNALLETKADKSTLATTIQAKLEEAMRTINRGEGDGDSPSNEELQGVKSSLENLLQEVNTIKETIALDGEKYTEFAGMERDQLTRLIESKISQVEKIIEKKNLAITVDMSAIESAIVTKVDDNNSKIKMLEAQLKNLLEITGLHKDDTKIVLEHKEKLPIPSSSSDPSKVIPKIEIDGDDVSTAIEYDDLPESSKNKEAGWRIAKPLATETEASIVDINNCPGILVAGKYKALNMFPGKLTDTEWEYTTDVNFKSEITVIKGSDTRRAVQIPVWTSKTVVYVRYRFVSDYNNKKYYSPYSDIIRYTTPFYGIEPFNIIVEENTLTPAVNLTPFKAVTNEALGEITHVATSYIFREKESNVVAKQVVKSSDALTGIRLEEGDKLKPDTKYQLEVTYHTNNNFVDDRREIVNFTTPSVNIEPVTATLEHRDSKYYIKLSDYKTDLEGFEHTATSVKVESSSGTVIIERLKDTNIEGLKEIELTADVSSFQTYMVTATYYSNDIASRTNITSVILPALTPTKLKADFTVNPEDGRIYLKFTKEDDTWDNDAVNYMQLYVYHDNGVNASLSNRLNYWNIMDYDNRSNYALRGTKLSAFNGEGTTIKLPEDISINAWVNQQHNINKTWWIKVLVYLTNGSHIWTDQVRFSYGNLPEVKWGKLVAKWTLEDGLYCYMEGTDFGTNELYKPTQICYRIREFEFNKVWLDNCYRVSPTDIGKFPKENTFAPNKDYLIEVLYKIRNVWYRACPLDMCPIRLDKPVVKKVGGWMEDIYRYNEHKFVIELQTGRPLWDEKYRLGQTETFANPRVKSVRWEIKDKVSQAVLYNELHSGDARTLKIGRDSATIQEDTLSTDPLKLNMSYNRTYQVTATYMLEPEVPDLVEAKFEFETGKVPDKIIYAPRVEIIESDIETKHVKATISNTPNVVGTVNKEVIAVSWSITCNNESAYSIKKTPDDGDMYTLDVSDVSKLLPGRQIIVAACYHTTELQSLTGYKTATLDWNLSNSKPQVNYYNDVLNYVFQTDIDCLNICVANTRAQRMPNRLVLSIVPEADVGRGLLYNVYGEQIGKDPINNIKVEGDAGNRIVTKVTYDGPYIPEFRIEGGFTGTKYYFVSTLHYPALTEGVDDATYTIRAESYTSPNWAYPTYYVADKIPLDWIDGDVFFRKDTSNVGKDVNNTYVTGVQRTNKWHGARDISRGQYCYIMEDYVDATPFRGTDFQNYNTAAIVEYWLKFGGTYYIKSRDRMYLQGFTRTDYIFTDWFYRRVETTDFKLEKKLVGGLANIYIGARREDNGLPVGNLLGHEDRPYERFKQIDNGSASALIYYFLHARNNYYYVKNDNNFMYNLLPYVSKIEWFKTYQDGTTEQVEDRDPDGINKYRNWYLRVRKADFKDYSYKNGTAPNPASDLKKVKLKITFVSGEVFEQEANV